jgi:hypothetical protein
MYKELVHTDTVGVSYIIFDTELQGKELKEYMARNSSKGYEFFETTFEDLELLLQENAVYSSFAFLDGERNKDNLVGGTKFVILDVDKSQITDEEIHVLLSDYNHYVVRTSDPDNEFKYRVILELDSVVDVEERLWKAFIQEIAAELGLVIDVLPQSQIFLAFKGRTILTQLEGKTLKTKFLLEQAAIRMSDKPKPAADLPQKVKSSQLDDPKETFAYAFAAEPGERSVCMYRALAHAIDLGADGKYIHSLAEEINEGWMDPMDPERLLRTLVKPALRKIGE